MDGSRGQPAGAGARTLDPVEPPLPPLTVAICSSRPANLERHLDAVAAAMGAGDRLLVVLDADAGALDEALLALFGRHAADVVVNGANLGLSHSRNVALDRCATDHILFVDDDVVMGPETVRGVRRAIGAGHQVVGVRLRLPETVTLPWYISTGQLHYLAVHGPGMPRTWGACMAFDVRLARREGIRFRHELGRRGRGLQCGDDTTFLDALRRAGACETMLRDVCAVHAVDGSRLSPGYVLRRAHWQGRSEVRRSNVVRGLRKEWLRFRTGTDGVAVPLLLAAFYMLVVVSGVLVEWVLAA